MCFLLFFFPRVIPLVLRAITIHTINPLDNSVPYDRAKYERFIVRYDTNRAVIFRVFFFPPSFRNKNTEQFNRSPPPRRLEAFSFCVFFLIFHSARVRGHTEIRLVNDAAAFVQRYDFDFFAFFRRFSADRSVFFFFFSQAISTFFFLPSCIRSYFNIFFKPSNSRAPERVVVLCAYNAYRVRFVPTE